MELPGEVGFLSERSTFDELVEDLSEEEYEFFSALEFGYPRSALIKYETAYTRTKNGEDQIDVVDTLEHSAHGNKIALTALADMLLGAESVNLNGVKEMRDLDMEDHRKHVHNNLMATNSKYAEIVIHRKNGALPAEVIRAMGEDPIEAELSFYGLQFKTCDSPYVQRAGEDSLHDRDPVIEVHEEGISLSESATPQILGTNLAHMQGELSQEDYKDTAGWAGTTAIYLSLAKEQDTEQVFLPEYIEPNRSAP